MDRYIVSFPSVNWRKAWLLVLLVIFTPALATPPMRSAHLPTSHWHAAHFPWWKSAVIYEVYLRSFKDSDGDGIGDLRGLISKLDYLKSLGVTMIWITPHYDSPNVDNGYDIRDYRKVGSIFGSMDDFDQLITAARHRQIRIMIDIVFNHTSDQHQWFRTSRESRTNPYRDYYIWRSNSDNRVPNNYPSNFGGSAWEFDPQTQQYYLHYFAKQQPDLNWDNPTVRNELYETIQFWTKKGVRGLRFDSITTISKDPTFHDLKSPENFLSDYGKGPNLHSYLQEMNRKIIAGHDYFAIGEMTRVPAKNLRLFIAPHRHELDAAINLDLIRIQRQKKPDWMVKPWTLVQFKSLIDRVDWGIGSTGWATFCLSNHDNARAVSTFGSQDADKRVQSAKALATILFTQRATPIIYQGEEIGMTNYPFQALSDFRDLWVYQEWKNYVDSGQMAATTYLSHVRKTGRDNARTPMQWDDSPAAGFTTGTPWIAVNPNYHAINAANDQRDPQSLFHYYQRLVRLRRHIPALVIGRYTDIDPSNPVIYAYTRTWMKERYLIVVNMSESPHTYRLPLNHVTLTPILTTQAPLPPSHSKNLRLSAWQAGIYRLSSR